MPTHRWEIPTSDGKFSLKFTPHEGEDDPEATAYQLGGDFTVKFWPRSFGRRTRIGILQLVRPLVDVGAYATNRTESGWAVDKHAENGMGVRRLADCLPYGTDGYVPRSVGGRAVMRFGEAGTEAVLRDTPREIVPVRVALAGSTKFAEYAVDVKNNRIFDQGIQWSYSGVDGVVTHEEPHKVHLSRSKEHRLAIVHFLGLCGKFATPNDIMAMTRA